MRYFASVRALTALAQCHNQLLQGGAKPIPVVLPLVSLQHFCATKHTLPGARFFATPNVQADDEERIPGNPKVNKIIEEILSLNLLEIADLTQILAKRLNIKPEQFSGPMVAAQPQQATAAPAAAKEPEAEKTEFDLKLQGFDAAAKIKVIKEIRGITSLGLKEAKELVEKAPVVVKGGISKSEAEELAKKIEAAGGKVSLD